jgi:3-phosphoshikimate 1-carboxyvinyltransferase
VRSRPRLAGSCRPPGDKSLSHRALILAALAGGETEIHGLNPGEDVESTARCLRALGVRIRRRGDAWEVAGGGREALRKPAGPLECGNSGTTMRLLAGVAAGLPFRTELRGDASLSARPMARIARPLRLMGARVEGRRFGAEIHAPLVIRGGPLRRIRWRQEVASAQVKSAVLLAAWTAGVTVEVEEPVRSRDHTERMMRALGVPVTRVAGGVRLGKGGTLAAPEGRVPGDPSAAAFLAAGAAALPGSRLGVEGVGLNPTRTGFFRVLARAGARMTVEAEGRWCGEPFGRITIRSSRLDGVRLGARRVPALLDEIPVLAVLAAGACRGPSRFTGAGELRFKESDRLAGLAAGLLRLGGDVRELPDGLAVRPGRLRGGTVDALGDHRLAMAFRIAALLARGTVRIRRADAARISDPGFERELRRLRA